MNLYDELEVSPTASQETIRAAYQSLVKRFHPDRNPGNQAAASRTQRINDAYKILSDPAARARYDQVLGTAGTNSGHAKAAAREQAAARERAAAAAREQAMAAMRGRANASWKIWARASLFAAVIVGFALWVHFESSQTPALPNVATRPTDATPAHETDTRPIAPLAAVKNVTIETDLYTAEIDTAGGVITLVTLNRHRDATDASKPYAALQRTAERTFVAQAGLIGEGLPNHRTQFEALPGPRELAAGSDRVELRLKANTSTGDPVVKVLTFHRGSYLIDVAFDITNKGAAPIAPYAYFQLMRDTKHAVVQNPMAPASYVGPVVFNDKDNFKKVDFGEIGKLAADPSRKLPYQKSADNGWIGMIEHYFVAAWLPSDEKKTPREFYTKRLDVGLYTVGVIVPVGTIAPGATGEVRVPLYVGPRDQSVLAKVAEWLNLVDVFQPDDAMVKPRVR